MEYFFAESRNIFLNAESSCHRNVWSSITFILILIERRISIWQNSEFREIVFIWRKKLRVMEQRKHRFSNCLNWTNRQLSPCQRSPNQDFFGVKTHFLGKWLCFYKEKRNWKSVYLQSVSVIVQTHKHTKAHWARMKTWNKSVSLQCWEHLSAKSCVLNPFYPQVQLPHGLTNTSSLNLMTQSKFGVCFVSITSFLSPISVGFLTDSSAHFPLGRHPLRLQTNGLSDLKMSE